MLIKESYKLSDGREGCRHYSDSGFFIHKLGTEEKFISAIDVEPCNYIYEETNENIFSEEKKINEQ